MRLIMIRLSFSFVLVALIAPTLCHYYLGNTENANRNRGGGGAAAAPDPDDPWNSCEVSEEDAEFIPWAARVRVILKSGAEKYFPATILNPYTLITYGGGTFTGTGCFNGQKLQLYSPERYLIQIGASYSHYHEANVSYVKPHPSFRGNRQYWMTGQNDFVLIHLSTPIQFSRGVRPSCLPNVTSANELNEVYLRPNTPAIIGGWARTNYLSVTTHLELDSFATCEDSWKNRTETAQFPFADRMCGLVTKNGTGNPAYECLVEDNGVHVRLEGKLFYIGFVNNYYSNAGVCSRNTRVIISLVTIKILDWVQKAIACGPLQYTCDNGQCIDRHLACNQQQDCADNSDEDPVYCRSFNFCDVQYEFECGIYGPCIPLHVDGEPAQNCDGVLHCPNGEDELPPMCPEAVQPTTAPPIDLIVGLGVTALVLTLLVSTAAVVRRIKLKREFADLTEEEVQEFEYGVQPSLAPGDQYGEYGDKQLHSDDDDELVLDAKRLPYNKEFEYELADCELGPTLGQGTFGIVRLGKLKGQAVAVKIPKEHLETSRLKALISELKFLVFVQSSSTGGGHQNVIKLIGAHTKGIRKRILHVAVEYCELGSLEEYLRQNRVHFHDEEEELKSPRPTPLMPPTLTSIRPRASATGHYITTESLINFSSQTLLKWTKQIVNGMMYLASKRIIHGDLAARNVLLTSDKIIKICDFGLAHQLYNYSSIYNGNDQAPIPWRWMPIEVLDANKFSKKTDVWSFAILLWELYTLGSQPWAGMECSPIFIQQLKAGQRLYRPEYANEQIFGIIQDCWQGAAENRPSFQDIAYRLEEEGLELGLLEDKKYNQEEDQEQQKQQQQPHFQATISFGVNLNQN